MKYIIKYIFVYILPLLAHNMSGDYMKYSKMGMDNEQYKNYVEAKAKKTNIIKNCIMAFVIGGLICILGQIIIDIGISNGLDKKSASCLASITLIFLAALFTALRIFHKIGKVAGAGTIVPITGFSNSIVSPAIEYKSEGLMLGIGANMFKVAGPVLVFGIGSSVIVGLIYWLVKYVF